MSKQKSQQIAAPRNGAFGKTFKFPAAIAAVIVMMVFGVGTAAAGTSDVNVVNTPTVNLGNTPTVSVANTPSVSPTPEHLHQDRVPENLAIGTRGCAWTLALSSP